MSISKIYSQNMTDLCHQICERFVWRRVPLIYKQLTLFKKKILIFYSNTC
jgi:hypothetical protein